MIRLRSGLWLMESSSKWGCNSFLIETSDRVFLVDPGERFQSDAIARELVAAGRSPHEVTDVLLTHYDHDHARSAAQWSRSVGSTVHLGAEDAEILRTRRVPGGRARRFLVRLWRLPDLPEGADELRGEVEIAPGLTALPTPGHTPGHYAFLWKDVALVGDAAYCGEDGELKPFESWLMTDPARSDATREMLAALPVGLYGCAHSPVVERGGTVPADHQAPRSREERFDDWVVLHPHSSILRRALASPTMAWRLGLGPIVSRARVGDGRLAMLTVTGRRSGVPRHAPVYLHEWRGDVYVWSPYGSRAQWYRNLTAHPVASVQSGSSVQAMRAKEIESLDDLRQLVDLLRDFDETFLHSYLASEGIEDTPESIAANKDRLHIRRLVPTDEPGPPALTADLAWVWLLPLFAVVMAYGFAAGRRLADD